MRLSLAWLKDYFPFTLSPQELADQLTMAGLEVEQIETKGASLENIVVGSVLETEKHPNADKLTVAKVSDGTDVFQVVCGAPNCRAGIKVAFAKIGAVFQDEQGSFTIKKSKLRGIESSGMLCSAAELGISEESNQIMELPPSWVEGTALKDFYADTFLEISLTPNLNHTASVMGVARELSAITGISVKKPSFNAIETGGSIEESIRVNVLDSEACPRYCCRMIKNVTVGPSPDWLKSRIEGAGLRSVNNVVDVTNYVLLECGHPLHAFNYDAISGEEIIVRKAFEGETIQTLDGKERSLKENHLLICDSVKPLAIAGIMGGLSSEVNASTRHVILESAYFDPSLIRRGSKGLGLQTDASRRFERGTDPNYVRMVLDRAAQMIKDVAGGEIERGVIDVKAKDFSELHLACRLSRINHVLGVILSRGEVETFFQNLGFNYQWDGKDKFTVTVPTFRVDIKGEIDLIEEVARLYGYDHIPREGGRFLCSSLPHAPIYLLENTVRKKMLQEGLQEFLTCDLIGPSILDIIQDDNIPDEMLIKVLNPTSIEQSILRPSLLGGLLQVVKNNISHQNSQIAGFEIGRMHARAAKRFEEQAVLGIVLSGNAEMPHFSASSRPYDFFDLKGIVENFLEGFGIQNPIYKNLGLKTFHDGRQASVFIENSSVELGSFGEIHPAIQRRLDVPQRILFAEFNLQNLLQFIKPIEAIKPLPIYPSSERDWTVTIQKSVPYETILQVIQMANSSLLEKVTLKGIYESEKMKEGYHNLTLHFVYRDLSKTIQNETVEKEQQRLTDAVIDQMRQYILI